MKTQTIIIIFISIFIVLLFFLDKHQIPDRIVLISFDVEPVDPDSAVIDSIEIIRETGINATFFVTGEYAQKHPDIIELMKTYEIACHGQTHRALTKLESAEKEWEIATCKKIVETVTNKKITGFRAPYNRIDSDSMNILHENGFLYDASIISGLRIIYPKPKYPAEIYVSSILGIPMEDVVFLHYIGLNKIFFYIIQNKNSALESYLFHPRHIEKHTQQLSETINHLKKQNVTFISHSQFIATHEGE